MRPDAPGTAVDRRRFSPPCPRWRWRRASEQRSPPPHRSRCGASASSRSPSPTCAIAAASTRSCSACRSRRARGRRCSSASAPGRSFSPSGLRRAGERPSISGFGMGVDDFSIERVVSVLGAHGVTRAAEARTAARRAPMTVRVVPRPGAFVASGPRPADVYVADPSGIVFQLHDAAYCGGAGRHGRRLPRRRGRTAEGPPRGARDEPLHDRRRGSSQDRRVLPVARSRRPSRSGRAPRQPTASAPACTS